MSLVARTTQCLLAAANFAAGGVAWAQPRGACARSSFTSDAPPTPAWRAAHTAVEAALARDDRPWGCAGARVRLTREPDGRAVVEAAMPDGATLRRHLAAPTELAVTVEGMLVVDEAPAVATAATPTSAVTSTSDPAAAPVVQAPAVRPVVDDERAPAMRPAAAPAPSVLLEGFVDVGGRTGGDVNYVSLSTRAGVSLRARRWVLSAWGRWEPVSERIDDQSPRRYVLGGVAFGVSGAWSAPVGRGLIEVGPTLAVAGYGWHERHRDTRRGDADVQARAGALLRWRSHARGLAVTATLDGDVGLGGLFGTADDASSTAPSAPAWTMGLSVGAIYGGAL